VGPFHSDAEQGTACTTINHPTHAALLRPDSVAIDVGAFQGGMLRHLFRLAPKGQHIAFEPVPENARRLQLAFTGATVHSCAVGDAPGQATFFEGLEHPALSGLRRRAKDLPKEPVREIQVTVDTLDRRVPRTFRLRL